MLIKSYGLFWERNDVFWGRQKNSGHLKGVAAQAKKSDPVDFREQVGLYALYDERHQLIYFGQAGMGKKHNLFDRLKTHRGERLASRWTRFSWFGILSEEEIGKNINEHQNHSYERQSLINHMEAIVLSVSEPPQNRRVAVLDLALSDTCSIEIQMHSV